MSISANYPNVRPSLLLDFANSQQLDPRVTYTRSTTAPYYDGKTSALAEQNLFYPSEQFDNANWGKTATTVTANTTVAPDGNTTADTVTADGTTGAKLISASNMGSVASPATARTVSIYAKAGTNNFLQIYFSGDGTPWADFDLSAGTVGSTGSNQTASIVALPNSWYRCILYTASTTATTVNFAIVSSSSATRGESNSLSTSVILWGAQLEQRSSVTAYNPTTTSALTNYIPQLLTAPINAPRFDFNPTTGESLGLLIEQSSTNLLTYSQDFSNGVWSKIGATITSASNIAPDGTQTMQTLVEDTSTGNHWVYQSAGSVGSNTATIYAKAYTRSWIVFRFTVSGTITYAWFNLSTGALGTVQSGLTASITSVGNGVYRCSITGTMSASSPIVVGIASGDNVTSYTGNGTSGVYIWGAQLEALAFPTSYIPTTSAQVTRASDNASMTGTNFSSWYNNAQGTLYSEVAVYNTSAAAMCVATLSDGTTNNRMELRPVSAAGSVNSRLFVVTSNSAQADIQTGTTVVNVFQKLSAIVQSSNFILSVAGASGTAVTTGQIPSVNQLTIGNSPATLPLNGRIKKLAYYSQAVTQTQNQALTGS
jgi:hypothetical protein